MKLTKREYFALEIMKKLLGDQFLAHTEVPKRTYALVDEMIKEEKQDSSLLINQVRNAFFHMLSAKTDWSRNEIKELFEAAVESTSE